MAIRSQQRWTESPSGISPITSRQLSGNLDVRVEELFFGDSCRGFPHRQRSFSLSPRTKKTSFWTNSYDLRRSLELLSQPAMPVVKSWSMPGDKWLMDCLRTSVQKPRGVVAWRHQTCLRPPEKPITIASNLSIKCISQRA